MTRERLIELWPVMEHFKNGGEVEFSSTRENSAWHNASSPQFSDPEYRFRIRPAKKLVPLEAEDWLKGGPWWVRRSKSAKHSVVYISPVGPVSETGYVMVMEDSSWFPMSPGEMMAKYQRRSASDPGGLWLPCSKPAQE